MTSAFLSAPQHWLQRLLELFSSPKPLIYGELKEEIQIRGREIRLPVAGPPVDLAMGRTGHILRIVPTSPLGGSSDNGPNTLMLLDPERFYDHMGGFLRLEPGTSLILGRGNEEQMNLFHYPQGINLRHLSITHGGNHIIINDFYSDHGTRVRPMRGEGEIRRHQASRLTRLRKVREIYGGPLRPMERHAAMALLKEVNQILLQEGPRPPDTEGKPGGVLILPYTITPVVVGDLHAQVDNLLNVLVELPVLEGLERGDQALVILGDAIHSEQDDAMEEMESSMLMMDLILALKRRFPSRVFYLLGNHDGFSSEIRKSGVSQGLEWEHHLRFYRGEAYKLEMDRFYELLPSLFLTPDLLACHAAPPKANVTMEMLINLHSYPGLKKEILWNRLQMPHRPGGYTAGDVKRLRKSLHLGAECSFIVAHNPLSREEGRQSVWLHAGNIHNHHIVFSGLPHYIGLFTRISGKLLPLTLPANPLLEFINTLPEG